VAALLGLLICGVSQAQAATTFNFTLNGSYTTSAGVYDSSGKLVRTLWRRVSYGSGPHTATWDNKNDAGVVQGAGTYTIKVLYHTVQPVWDGVIGNTSSAFSGPSVWRAFNPVAGIAIDSAGNAYAAMGYNEAQNPFYRFNVSSPQTITAALGSPEGIYTPSWVNTATDGTRVYFACPQQVNPSGNGYVVAYNVSDNSAYTFSSGTTIGPYNGVRVGTQTGLSGIAVQTVGTVLAASVGPDNKVYLLNKTTGASTGSITITNPQKLAFAPNGDLWVLSGTTAQRFAAGTLGSTNTPATTISGFSGPLAIAVHPSNNNIVLVADGGTSQQVKGYTSTGATASGWTTPFGVAGGYDANGPAVTNTKLQFRSINNGIALYTCLAFQSDGSFWVGDTVNTRLLHISSAQAYLGQIAYVPVTYTAAVDPNNPVRAIDGDFLEYQLDYTKPLKPGDPQATGGNGSWKLVKNWSAPLTTYVDGSGQTQYKYYGFKQGLYDLATLSNGRTYARMTDYQNNVQTVVELPASGALRFTGVNLVPGSNLYPDGSQRYVTFSGGVQTFYKKALTGFDAYGNPLWAAPAVIASAPSTSGVDPISGWAYGSNVPITSSNVLVSLDGSLNSGMHLGGIATGGSAWSWEASPSVTTNIPPDGLGSYDIGDGTNYGGNIAMTSGRSIIYGYNGEFWNQTQMDQYMYFNDDGLFVTQFGTPGNYTINGWATPGIAGNAFSPNLISTNGEVYLFHNDESNHAGLHRWHMIGANSIQEASGSGALNATVTLTAPAPAFPTALAATPGNAQVALTWVAASGATSYNVKYSTTSGGPWTVIAGIASGVLNYTVSALTNDTPYYFVVTAQTASGESAASNQARSMPFSSTVAVHPAGQLINSGTLDLPVISANPAAGLPALSTLPRDLLDCTQSLTLDNVGAKGYVIYDFSGSGSDTSNVLSPFTVPAVTHSGGWTDQSYVGDAFSINGTMEAFISPYTLGYGLQSNPVGTININSDSNWHYLTVFSPTKFADGRAFSMKLTPQGFSTPAVTYTVNDGAFVGENQIFQFLFTGNVTLTVDSTGGNEGIVKAIFLDNAPSPLAAPAAPTGLTAVAGNAQIALSWTAVPGAASYNVYRGTTAGGESTTPIYTGITGTTKIDTGLTNGTAYYYKVKAVNASGTSGYSNEAAATPSASANAWITRTASAPAIDGAVDTVWSSAPQYNITTVVNGSTTITGSWKAMWDSSKLYLLGTVADASLINGVNDYNGDSIELYIDADNSKNTTYGANDFQYILGWGHSAITEYAHSATSGVTFAQTNITGGYRMEFAIPWSTLTVTPAANNLIGIDAGIDDAASTTARAGQIMWHGTDNNFINPSLFGTGVLLP